MIFARAILHSFWRIAENPPGVLTEFSLISPMVVITTASSILMLSILDLSVYGCSTKDIIRHSYLQEFKQSSENMLVLHIQYFTYLLGVCKSMEGFRVCLYIFHTPAFILCPLISLWWAEELSNKRRLFIYL